MVKPLVVALYRLITQIETIPQEMIDGFDNIRNGLDFGYADDPLAFVRWHYDKRNGLFTLSMNITVFRLVIGNMQTKCGKKISVRRHLR